MYYEQNPKRQKKIRRRRSCLGRLFRLALVLVVLWALISLGAQWIGYSPFGADLSVNSDLPRGTTNVLLLGVDKASGGGSRSDSILIASFTGGGIKLTSIMRDTMVDIPGSGTHKINAAYRLGGADLAMRTVNEAFGMNITKYATIDFEGIAKVIDAMGGIELTISKAEMNEINGQLKNAYKNKRVYNGVLMTPLTDYGEGIHLSGTHAMFYARIRYIDSDYKRAERQRILLQQMLEKVRRTRNPIALVQVAAAILECTATNLSVPELMALGLSALTSGAIEQFRVPVNGTYSEGMSGGVWSIRPNLEKNQKLLKEFVYG